MSRAFALIAIFGSAAYAAPRLAPTAWTPDLFLLAAVALGLAGEGPAAAFLAITLGGIADLVSAAPPGSAPPVLLAATLAARGVFLRLFPDRPATLALASAAGALAALATALLLVAVGLPGRRPFAVLPTIGFGTLVLWPWARLAAYSRPRERAESAG